MLIKKSALDRIAQGEVSLAFRRWRRPTVKSGTRLRTAFGLIAIDAITPVDEKQITLNESLSAGYASREELVRDLRSEGTLYRIELRCLGAAGADPRVELREKADLSTEELAEIARRLARLDRPAHNAMKAASARSEAEGWTLAVLEAIEKNPDLPARELALQTPFAKEVLKVKVRKLKELGLTESRQPGYRLSARGRVVLNYLREQSSRE